MALYFHSALHYGNVLYSDNGKVPLFSGAPEQNGQCSQEDIIPIFKY